MCVGNNLRMGVDDRVPVPAEPADALMSRGVFARRSGLSLKALRLYERQGLLVPARVDIANRYRWYRESQMETARLIVLLRRLGMSLAQIADVVAPPARGAEIIAAYWDSVERRTAQQRELADHIRRQLSDKATAAAVYDVRERGVPEQLVLTEKRRLGIDELESWVGAAQERLIRSARQCGGVTGPIFRIFRGVVSEDSEDYVEVCVPVDPDHRVPVGAVTRVEPAHREVYVTLSKAQFEYPQVLTGYRTLEQWICDKSLGSAGAPREVYRAGVDVDRAAPSDAVCDVAYPITDSPRS